ncbi:hypothetical protein ABIA39_007117 [Nocardia sp. GAS34]
MCTNDSIDRCGEVVQQMPPIGDLDRGGCAAAGAVGVGAAAVTANDPNLRMLAQPVCDRVGGAVFEQHTAGQDNGIAPPASEYILHARLHCDRIDAARIGCEPGWTSSRMSGMQHLPYRYGHRTRSSPRGPPCHRPGPPTDAGTAPRTPTPPHSQPPAASTTELLAPQHDCRVTASKVRQSHLLMATDNLPGPGDRIPHTGEVLDHLDHPREGPHVGPKPLALGPFTKACSTTADCLSVTHTGCPGFCAPANASRPPAAQALHHRDALVATVTRALHRHLERHGHIDLAGTPVEHLRRPNTPIPQRLELATHRSPLDLSGPPPTPTIQWHLT